MAKPNPRIDELETDISEIKISIDDQDIPEETRNELKESLGEMEAELSKLKTPKEKKPKKEKPAKPEVMFGEKPFKETSASELTEAWNKRKEEIGLRGGKSKTKSIFHQNGATNPQAELTQTV